uniref:Ig-like domain-containing protein n=2 Tax=Pygocentrus nattereri TaxID=42514 RepID=A0A3B4DR44_PYGNA
MMNLTFEILLNIFFSFLTGVSSEDLITSHGSVKQARDGESVTLSCNYNVSQYGLFWYRQYSRSKPEFLLSTTESGGTVKADPAAQFSATVDKIQNSKVLNLVISSAAVSDSALYYCALKPTVTGNPATLYKNTVWNGALFLLMFLCFCTVLY